MGPNSEMRFVVGCSSKQLCNAISGMTGNTMCSECCNTSLCNNELCEKKTTTVPPTTTTLLPSTKDSTTLPTTTHAHHIFYHPPVASMPSHVTHAFGSHFSLTCQYSGSRFPTVNWYYNGNATLPQNTMVSKHGRSSVLYISNATQDTGGRYSCVVVNQYGNATATTDVIITGVKPTFIERPPPHMDMFVDMEYSVTCRASGMPTPIIHWSFNIPHPSMSALSALNTSQDQTTLHITDPPMDLAGGFVMCTYSNAYGSVSAKMTLSVNQATTTTQKPTTHAMGHVHISPVPPTISLPASLDVQIGANVVIPCNATGSPTPHITWSQLPGNFPSNVHQHGNKLEISNASPTNSRLYMCKAVNIHGNALKLIKVNIHGDPPSITHAPISTNVTHGDTVILRCEANGSPSPTITWTWKSKANGMAVDEGGLKLIPGVSIHDTRLTITNAFELHSGMYVCTAKNTFGTVTSDAVVNVQSAHVNVPPTISISPLMTSTLYGSNVSIHYDVTGDPAPSVSCLYNRSQLPGNVLMTQTNLNVIMVTDKNSGRYQCNAHNIEGSDTVEFQIEVIGMKPSFITKPVTTTVLFGTHSSLTCTAAGFPTPTITWEYRSVSGSTRIPAGTTTSADNSVLTIKSTQDSGTFICHADNVYGRATAQASVYVKTGSLIG